MPWESFELNDDEFLVADAVSIRNELTIGQIQDILQKSVYPVLKTIGCSNHFHQRRIEFREIQTQIWNFYKISHLSTKRPLIFLRLCIGRKK